MNYSGLFKLTTVTFTVMATLAGCNKAAAPDGLSSEQLVFTAGDAVKLFETNTKATEVTTTANLSTIYVSATTGAAGAEAAAWTSHTFTRAENEFRGGKWWPSTNPGYHFYASNVALTHSAGGALISATTDKDVVVAHLAAPVYKIKNELLFTHVFARIGTVTVVADEGYTISNVSIKLIPKTGGTYDLVAGEGKTDGTGWSNLTTAAAPSEIANALGANANDIYLVPGNYTLMASWKAVKGGYEEDITGMMVDADLTGGSINTLTATLGGNAVGIRLNVTVEPWIVTDAVDVVYTN